MEKVLSIVIPSYNVEKTLGETIESMLDDRILSDIEILVVNDGSKDATASMGKKYQSLYPYTVRYIEKENGGHGSTINRGIKEADGKYFKVVDGDDWLLTENLIDLVERLKRISSDLVYNPFYTVHDKTKHRELVDDAKNVKYENEYKFDDICKDFIIPMHSLTIKTSILKENNIWIDEKRFYVDAEYILLPIPYVQTITFFEDPIYLYRIFTEGQSMNIKNMQKNINHHFDVVFRMVSFYEETKNIISETKRKYLEWKILKLIETQYQIYFSFPYDKRVAMQIQEFNSKLQSMSEELYEKSMGKTVKWVRKSVRLFYPLARLREKVR